MIADDVAGETESVAAGRRLVPSHRAGNVRGVSAGPAGARQDARLRRSAGLPLPHAALAERIVRIAEQVEPRLAANRGGGLALLVGHRAMEPAHNKERCHDRNANKRRSPDPTSRAASPKAPRWCLEALPEGYFLQGAPAHGAQHAARSRPPAGADAAAPEGRCDRRLIRRQPHLPQLRRRRPGARRPRYEDVSVFPGGKQEWEEAGLSLEVSR